MNVFRMIDNTEWIAIDTISTIEKKLDEKFARWDVYRNKDKTWNVSVSDESRTEVFSGDCFLQCMEKASQFAFIPKLPKRPDLFSGYQPVRDGSQWRIKRVDGTDGGIRVKSKKEAESFIEQMSMKSSEAMVEWDEKYALQVSQGLEGVDYIF